MCAYHMLAVEHDSLASVYHGFVCKHLLWKQIQFRLWSNNSPQLLGQQSTNITNVRLRGRDCLFHYRYEILTFSSPKISDVASVFRFYQYSNTKHITLASFSPCVNSSRLERGNNCYLPYTFLLFIVF